MKSARAWDRTQDLQQSSPMYNWQMHMPMKVFLENVGNPDWKCVVKQAWLGYVTYGLCKDTIFKAFKLISAQPGMGT